MDFFVNSVSDLFAWIFVVGAALAVAAVVAMAVVAVVWLRGSVATSALLVTLVLSVTAVLIAMLGLIGDYTQRIYRQSSGRPFYLVRRVHDAPGVAQQSRVG